MPSYPRTAVSRNGRIGTERDPSASRARGGWVRRGAVSEEDGTDFQFHFISRDWLGMPNSRFSATRKPFFFRGDSAESGSGMGIKALAGLPNLATVRRDPCSVGRLWRDLLIYIRRGYKYGIPVDRKQRRTLVGLGVIYLQGSSS